MVLYFQNKEITYKEAVCIIDSLFSDDENYDLARWPYIKKLDSHAFELKIYWCNPPVKICLNIIDELLISMETYAKNIHSTYIIQWADFYYTKDEVRRILYKELKKGYSEIYYQPCYNKKNELVFNINISEVEFIKQISSGYISFEYGK